MNTAAEFGASRVYRLLAPTNVVTIVKKTKTRPWGLNGGLEGETNQIILRPGTEREERTGAVNRSMEPDEVVMSSTGGGGGWGNPLHCNPGKVLEDVRNGYVSLESAQRDYGVVIDTATWTVDVAATSTLRRERLGA